MAEIYSLPHNVKELPKKYNNWNNKVSSDGRSYQLVAIKERNFPILSKDFKNIRCLPSYDCQLRIHTFF